MWVMSHKVIHRRDKLLFTINCKGKPADIVEKGKQSKDNTSVDQLKYP